MKFNISFFIFITMLTLAPHFAQADQLTARYSAAWSNTVNIRWDNEKNESLGWMQVYAKAEKQSDGTSKCAVYCQRTTSSVITDLGLNAGKLECGIWMLRSKLSESFNKVYNQIAACSVQNGEVVWPFYDEVVKTYKNNGTDTVFTVDDENLDDKPQEMELVSFKK